MVSIPRFNADSERIREPNYRISQGFEELGRNITALGFEILTPAMEKEGAAAGARAQEPAPRNEDGTLQAAESQGFFGMPTARSRAFNTAANRLFSIQKQEELNLRADELFGQNANNPEAYREAMIAYRDQWMQGIPDHLSAPFLTAFGEKQAQGAVAIQQQVRADQLEAYSIAFRNTLATKTSKLTSLINNSGMTPEAERLIAEIEADIAAAKTPTAEGMRLTERAAQLEIENLRSQVLVARAVREYNRSGGGRAFMEGVASGQLFPEATDRQRREILAEVGRLDTLRRQQRMENIQLAEQAQRLAERARQERGDAAQRNLVDAMIQGDTARMQTVLQQSRGDLSPQAYERWMGMSAQPAGFAPEPPQNNAAVLFDLVEATRTLPPDQALQAIRKARSDGNITTPTMRDLMGSVQAEQDKDRLPGPMRAALQSIETILDPKSIISPGSDILRGQVSLLQAQAILEMTTWGRQNPNATPEEIETKRQSVVNRHQSSFLRYTRESLPLPHGFVGSRSQVTVDVIERSRRSLIAELAKLDRNLRSNLTREDVVRLFNQLDQWENVLQQTSQPTAPPSSNNTNTGRGQPR
jgi:hypothetical protein